MNNLVTPIFFDYASTSRCSTAADDLVRLFAVENFGNPSSAHIYGQKASSAIREARLFFSKVFCVEPDQVIFTGSGTEANNLAIQGTALKAMLRGSPESTWVHASATEHASVRNAVKSLGDFGIQTKFLEVERSGQLSPLAPKPEGRTVFSLHQVNNTVGTILPVEEIARSIKNSDKNAIIHTDSIQAFGKISVPGHPSAIDLISISSHKIEGPKGVGALIVLNKELLRSGLRPLLFGGEQEGGFRSGTENPGLIAGFHRAASEALCNREASFQYVLGLNSRFRELLLARGLLGTPGIVRWNSPEHASPYIVNISIPGLPSGPLAKLLEERGCIVSVGSACSARKNEPDLVLKAMGFPSEIQTSSLRISFSRHNRLEEIDILVKALAESILHMSRISGKDRLSGISVLKTLN